MKSTRARLCRDLIQRQLFCSGQTCEISLGIQIERSERYGIIKYNAGLVEGRTTNASQYESMDVVVLRHLAPDGV